MALRDRIVPVIVASPLFLQNLDASVMATALPSIAHSLNVLPLQLNLAITSYLLSLAVFLPVSGWLAERFGPKRVFCVAIGLFALSSAFCGMAQSLPALVLFRILQGMGGAMMVPVGRLILLRSVPKERLISAMVWFTIPPVMGRLLGPLIGGAIVTLTSWRWIFLLNIPFGVFAVLLALWLIDEQPPGAFAQPFDLLGFVWLALGLTGVLGAFETLGKDIAPDWVIALAGLLGAACLYAYVRHGRAREEPLIDLGLLRFRTFFTSMIGSIPLRIAIGALPFLMPLMLQLGFGLSPLAAGMLTVGTAVGSLATRFIMAQAMKRLGFRTVLLTATCMTSIFYFSYSLFTPSTSHTLMFIVMIFGGLFTSTGMVSMQTLGFSDIPKPRMSHATAISSMMQQLTISAGVVVASSLVTLAAWWRGGAPGHLQARDFSPAFAIIGAFTLVSLVAFRRLDENEGAGLR